MHSVSGCSAGTSATNAAHYPQCHPLTVSQHRGTPQGFSTNCTVAADGLFRKNWTLILKLEDFCINSRQLNFFLAFTSEVEVAVVLCLILRGQR